MGSLFLFLLGCRPECTPLSQVRVHDPDDLIDPETEARAQAAIDDYAALTGRETACVPEVLVVPDAGQRWAGRFNGRRQPIFIRRDHVTEPVIWHELTHAVDEAEGLVARAHPRLFREEWIGNTDVYDTKNLRRDEVFAQLAEPGPQAVALTERAWRECGEQVDDRFHANRFVQHYLWTAVDEAWWTDDLRAVSVGDEQIADIQAAPGTRIAAWRALGDHTVRIVQLRADRSSLRLVVADRWTNQTLWAAPFDPGDLDFETLFQHQWPRMVEGLDQGRPVVWLWVPGLRMQTWKVDLDAQRVTAEPPILPWWLGEQHVLGVVDATVFAVDDGRLTAVDRRHHTPLPMTRDEPDDEVLSVGGVHLLPDGIEGFTTWGAPFTIDLSTRRITRGAEIPSPLQITSPTWAGDGRWVAWGLDHGEDFSHALAALMVWDPDTASWRGPDDLCPVLWDWGDGPGLRGGADGAWLVEYQPHEDGRWYQHAWPVGLPTP